MLHGAGDCYFVGVESGNWNPKLEP